MIIILASFRPCSHVHSQEQTGVELKIMHWLAVPLQVFAVLRGLQKHPDFDWWETRPQSGVNSTNTWNADSASILAMADALVQLSWGHASGD